MASKKHIWVWEYQGIETSAYCICCGMQRIVDFKSELNIWRGVYLLDGIKNKKAGPCSNNVSDENISIIISHLNAIRETSNLEELTINSIKEELLKPVHKRNWYRENNSSEN